MQGTNAADVRPTGAIGDYSMSVSVVDEKRLAALRASIDAADFQELRARVPALLEARIAGLRRAAAHGDFTALEHEAHALISAAGNLGAKPLSALAAELEISASRRDRAAIAKIVCAIDDNAPLTLAALRAMV